MEILPSFDPEITKLLSGENATVQRSTGPKTTWFKSLPSDEFQMQRVESSELLAISKIKNYKEHFKRYPSEYCLHFPLGDTSTETIPSEWPVRLYKWLNELLSTFHTLTSGFSFPWWIAPETMKSYSFLISFSRTSSSSPSGLSVMSFSLFSSELGISVFNSPQLHVL